MPDSPEHVTAPDGVRIAVWPCGGSGRPLVLVHGTSADHTRWTPVLPALSAVSTVYALDRRGRGGSSDRDGYSIADEFRDVAAVVDAIAARTGGPVDLLGHSYGAVCALEGARLTSSVRRLVLYEPPVVAPPSPPELLDRLDALVAAGDRDGAVTTFFREVVGADDAQLRAVRAAPSWPARLAAAHTLSREQRFEDGYSFDAERFQDWTVPTLLVVGDRSAPFLQDSMQLLETHVPATRLVVLPGQGHVAMDTGTELFNAAVIAFITET
ncbi:MAG: alpha/beta fold hydrolase [Actinomycetes bacterium]